MSDEVASQTRMSQGEVPPVEHDRAQLKFELGCADRTAHEDASICFRCGWNEANGALPWEADR
jgi:hypothetical protein